LKILSLFANVGFGEFYLKENNFNVVVANELLQDRVDFYKTLYPDAEDVICGDICDQNVKSKIISKCEAVGPIDIVLATPPCQGMSLANAAKESSDPRNTLIVHAMEIFKSIKAKYMLIENVTNMPNTYIHHKQYGQIKIIDYINKVIPEGFKSKTQVVDGKFFNTPQERKRSITLISPNGEWGFPTPNTKVATLKNSIEYLPSIEADTASYLKWHFSSKHNSNHINWMKNAPEGRSAYFNKGDNYPCKIINNSSNQTIKELIKNGDKGWHTNCPVILNSDGSFKQNANIVSETTNGKLQLFAEIPPNTSLKREIYGFTTAYKRMSWNKPAPTVTMTNGSISSQNNVHPGRKNGDEFSDARVLTIREVLLVCGLPPDLLDRFAHEITVGTKFKFQSGQFGYDYHPSFIRKVLGELFLPKVCLAIMQSLPKKVNKKTNNSVQLEFDYV
jgi:DNA (cytosine-5)-methyltransferase 1